MSSTQSLKRVRIDELANKHYNSAETSSSQIFYNDEETALYIHQLESKISILEMDLQNHKFISHMFPEMQKNAPGLYETPDRTRAYMDPLLDVEFTLMRKKEKDMELQIFRLEEKLRDAMAGRPVVHDFATSAQSFDEHGKAERQLDLENRNQKLEIVDLRKQLELATKALAESEGVVSELHDDNNRLTSQIFLLKKSQKV